MVKFEETMGGFDVLVDGELFGRLQKEHGFFTDSTVVRKFMEVSANDLAEIARKADEVKRFGKDIPFCPSCEGTPNFPGTVYSPCRGMMPCRDSHMHPFRNL